MYLGTIGLGVASLGLIEGLADFLVSLSKLVGETVGHYVHRKKPLTAAGYLVTTLGTSGIAMAHSLQAVLGLRALAWAARGFRSPLRDYLLAESVESKYYGRAYGLERAGDMLGAVVGPLMATLLLWSGMEFRTVMLYALLPGLLATGAMLFFVHEKEDESRGS